VSILAGLNALLTGVIPVETGIFSGKAPDEYVVITPLLDIFEVHADDVPGLEVQEARLSLFCKGSYTRRKNQLAAALLNAKFTVTSRRYLGYENDTGYHHYVIDVAKEYELQEE
jgi:hypothetical protein